MDETLIAGFADTFCRALDRGMSARGVAALLEVSPATGVRWAKAWRTTGSIEPGKVGGHMRPLLEGEREWLLARLERDKDVTLHALLAMLREERGVEVCCDTLWRFLKRCGKTFKKDALRQGAGAGGCRPQAQALVRSPAADRRRDPQAHGLHRRDLGEDQHDPHSRLERPGHTAD